VKVVFYVTGHGFGHATRALLVLEELGRITPLDGVSLRTTVPRGLIAKYYTRPFDLLSVDLDGGVRELSPMETDIPGTLRLAQDNEAVADAIVAAEVCSIRADPPCAVLYDASPLAARIAEQAGVPSIGMTNFTWDFIYRDFAALHPPFAEFADRMRSDYARTTLFCRMPLSHPMEGMHSVRDVSLVARKHRDCREEVRRALGLRESDVVAVAAMRGASLGLRVDGSGLEVLSFGELAGDGVRQLGPEWDNRFSDVVAASDVVLSKPGYGIVSECLANGKPLLHLERHGFAETPLLIAGMEGRIPHRAITRAELGSKPLHSLVLPLLEKESAPVEATGAREIAESVCEFVGLERNA
jgi:L-arabinokinase